MCATTVSSTMRQNDVCCTHPCQHIHNNIWHRRGWSKRMLFPVHVVVKTLKRVNSQEGGQVLLMCGVQDLKSFRTIKFNQPFLQTNYTMLHLYTPAQSYPINKNMAYQNGSQQNFRTCLPTTSRVFTPRCNEGNQGYLVRVFSIARPTIRTTSASIIP